MARTSDLYQRLIFDHNRNPKNFHALEKHTHTCEGNNPLCGDKITVYLLVNDEETIEDISFSGSGCAIFKASASIMTEYLKNRTVAEAAGAFEAFQKITKGEMDASGLKYMGKLAVFQGVREFPSRIKCATLPWHTTNCALEEKEAASTENRIFSGPPPGENG